MRGYGYGECDCDIDKFIKPDEFVCKKIDKEFKETLIKRCKGSLKLASELINENEWNHFDNSYHQENKDKVIFYKKLLALIESMQVKE